MANEITNAMVTKMSPSANGSSTVSTQNSGQASVAANIPSQDSVTSVNVPEQAQTSLESSQPALSQAELQNVVNELNDQIQTVQRDLSFTMDEGSGKTVIKVMDSDSGEVIRQIPSEEVLAIASYFKEVRESAEQSEVAPGLLFSDST